MPVTPKPKPQPTEPRELFLPDKTEPPKKPLDPLQVQQRNAKELQKLQDSVTNLIENQLGVLKQEDLEFLIQRGVIDESQAFLIWELFVSKKQQQSFSLQSDIWLLEVIPVVYCLHFGFFIIAFAGSMVHKHFTLRFSVFFFLAVKLFEIIFFYVFGLYLQDHGCILFSTAVHIIFDLTIYNLLLDLLSFLEFNAEEFEFNFVTEGTHINIMGKIVFNVTLLGISYISSLQFKSSIVPFFFFWYLGYLVFRVAVLLKDQIHDFFQPFPYFSLSAFALLLFLYTLLVDQNSF